MNGTYFVKTSLLIGFDGKSNNKKYILLEEIEKERAWDSMRWREREKSSETQNFEASMSKDHLCWENEIERKEKTIACESFGFGNFPKLSTIN